MWVITRKKLGLNYGKPMLKYNTRPENAEKNLKKTQQINSKTANSNSNK